MAPYTKHTPQYIEKACQKTGLWPWDLSKLQASFLTKEQLEEKVKSLYVVPTVIPSEKKSIKKYLTTKGKIVTESSIRNYLKKRKIG